MIQTFSICFPTHPQKGQFKQTVMNWIVFVVWLIDERCLALFLAGTMEILTIANLWHAVSSIWTCTEPKFRLCWMKLCSSDNCYTIYSFYYKRYLIITLLFINLPLQRFKQKCHMRKFYYTRSWVLLQKLLHKLFYSWRNNDCITSRVPIVTKSEIRKKEKLQKLIHMKDFWSLIPPSILSDNMYHFISGVAFFNKWFL